MAMTVADASVFVPSFVDVGATSRRARERLAREAELHAPHVLDLEVAAGLRRAIARGTIRNDEGATALRALADMPIIRYPHLPLLERVWAIGGNVTPYDAAYVALAEYLDTTLLTADARLARAPGPRCRIELLA
jgi:predicted nucleic acid-binding protein